MLLYVRQNFALEDPYLNTDLTVGGVCFPETVLDVCTEGLERNSTFMIVLGVCDFSAAKATDPTIVEKEATANADAQKS